MAKKQFMKVSVQTLPNGYSLDVDGKGFMYYNLQGLVEGIFVHVGLQKLDYLDNDIIADLMTACATWPKEGDAIRDAARLTVQIETLQQSLDRNASTINRLKSQLADTQQKLADSTAKLARFLSAEKPVKEDKKQPNGESRIVTRGDLMPKAKAQKTTSNITKGDVVQKKPKSIKKAEPKPQTAIQYSEAVYQSLMLPLTMDKTGLPTRVLSVMKVVGGSSNATVGDALTHTKKEFMKVRGFGKGVAEKLEAFLSRHHLDYGMNVEAIMMQHAMNHNPNIK